MEKCKHNIIQDPNSPPYEPTYYCTKCKESWNGWEIGED